jgi:hypothetical protein
VWGVGGGGSRFKPLTPQFKGKPRSCIPSHCRCCGVKAGSGVYCERYSRMVALHWHCMEMMEKTLQYQEDDGANGIARPARFKSADLADCECCDSAPLL